MQLGFIGLGLMGASLAANLQTKAATFESHHRGSSPWAGVVFVRTAGHHAATVAPADDKCRF